MKLLPIFGRPLMVIGLALVTAGTTGHAQVPPEPSPAPVATTVSALPADVMPGSPLAEVIKLIQAGMDLPTIQSFIANSQSPFNLNADEIIFLKDEGAPSVVINAMMDRDKVLYSSANTPPQPVPQPPPQAPPPPDPTVDNSAPAPDTTDTTDTAPPAGIVDMNYFTDVLMPYGSWITVDGYGTCWRPTSVVYDSTWQPYCDRGHWVYTDYGWYWDSDYAWGVTFHYGRWFNSPQFGWCWYPDTVWAPSWVTWRWDADYCGWAPLPPFAVYTPGVGFLYQGVEVAMDFDFGLPAGCFVFVPTGNFCDRHPKSYVVQQQYVAQIFSRTKTVNNFSANGKTLVNRGFGAENIARATQQTIQPVHLSSLPNAGLQGWRGTGYQQTMRRSSTVQTVQSWPQGGYQNGTYRSRRPWSNGQPQSCQPYYNQQPQGPAI